MSRQRTVIGVVALLAVFGIAATAGATTPPKKDPDPPDPDPGPDDDDDDTILPGVIHIPDVDWPTQPHQPVQPGFDPNQPWAPVDPVQDPPLADVVKTFPEGGAFYQVIKGDRFGGTTLTGPGKPGSIAHKYLMREAFKAAREVGGLPEPQAHEWAKQFNSSGGAALRLQAIDYIQCMWINDALYGTWGYGPQAHASPHGRAIRLIPQHADNLQRLQDGYPLARHIQLRTPADKGKGNATGIPGGSFELLWMPELNKTVLWGDGSPQGSIHRLTTEGPVWPNGDSKMNPPPWIMALGVVDNSGSGYDDYGC